MGNNPYIEKKWEYNKLFQQLLLEKENELSEISETEVNSSIMTYSSELHNNLMQIFFESDNSQSMETLNSEDHFNLFHQLNNRFRHLREHLNFALPQGNGAVGERVADNFISDMLKFILNSPLQVFHPKLLAVYIYIYVYIEI